MRNRSEGYLTVGNKLKAVALLGATTTVAVGLWVTDNASAEGSAHKAPVPVMAAAKPNIQATPKTKVDAIVAQELALVDESSKMTPSQKAYDKEVVEATTRLAFERQNFNPAAVGAMIIFEGGWGKNASAKGNYSGTKCDAETDMQCGPLVWTQEDRHDGRGLVWVQDRFQVIPGKTQAQKIAGNVMRISNLIKNKAWFDDVRIASYETDPTKNTAFTMLAFEDWTDGHGHIIHKQGEKDAKGNDLVQSYATLDAGTYIGRVEGVMDQTDAAKVYAPFWSEVDAHPWK